MFLKCEVPLYMAAVFVSIRASLSCGSGPITDSEGDTGVPCSYETAPPYDPTVGICLGPYGGLRGGGAVSYERGTPVKGGSGVRVEGLEVGIW